MFYYLVSVTECKVTNLLVPAMFLLHHAIYDFDLLWIILKAMFFMFLLITLIDRTETNWIQTVALGEPEPNFKANRTEPEQ